MEPHKMLIIDLMCTLYTSSLSFISSIWAFSTVGFGYDETCGTNFHNEYVHVAATKGDCNPGWVRYTLKWTLSR